MHAIAPHHHKPIATVISGRFVSIQSVCGLHSLRDPLFKSRVRKNYAQKNPLELVIARLGACIDNTWLNIGISPNPTRWIRSPCMSAAEGDTYPG